MIDGNGGTEKEHLRSLSAEPQLPKACGGTWVAVYALISTLHQGVGEVC